MTRQPLQPGATGSFHWANPTETNFDWRYGYYTDTDEPDAWARLRAEGAHWGPAETEQLRTSMRQANAG
jgi:hypothetical protein